MNIPERLWRVAKGHWTLASEQFRTVEEKIAEADAYKELADALKKASEGISGRRGDTSAGPAVETSNPTPDPPATLQPRDPLEACYALLQVDPSCDLATLESARARRLQEIDVEGAPEGSPDRINRQARREVVEAAYDRLRDLLNPTETRFERLEF